MDQEMYRWSDRYYEIFREQYFRWKHGKQTSKETMEILGICSSTFYSQVKVFEKRYFGRS